MCPRQYAVRVPGEFCWEQVDTFGSRICRRVWRLARGFEHLLFNSITSCGKRQTVCNFVKFPWGGLELCSCLVEHSPCFLSWELIPVCGNTWVFCVTLMRTSSLTDCGYSEGKGGFWRRKGRWVILVYEVYCWLRPGNGLEANKFYKENTLAPVRTRVSVLDEDCSYPGPESPRACDPE